MWGITSPRASEPRNGHAKTVGLRVSRPVSSGMGELGPEAKGPNPLMQ